MNEQSKSQVSDDEIESAKIGYQTAINLWIYEGGLIWSKFNALLVANSIVLAIIGLTLNTNNFSPILAIGMPAIGLLLSFAWFLLTKRGFDNYIYWIISAREIEEKYLAPFVKTVSRGGVYADGNTVEMTINGKIHKYQMSRISRVLQAEWSSYFVITAFLIMYLLLLFFR